MSVVAVVWRILAVICMTFVVMSVRYGAPTWLNVSWVLLTFLCADYAGYVRAIRDFVR